MSDSRQGVKNGRYDDNREAGLDHTFDNTAGLNATTLGRSVASISASPQGLIFGPSFRDGCYFSAGIWFDLRTRFRK
jgi:hypothetical protein